MNVIRHYAPGAQKVTLGVKVAQSLGHDFGDAGIAEVALPETGIQRLLGFFQEGAAFGSTDLVGRNGRGDGGWDGSGNVGGNGEELRILFPMKLLQ